MADKVYSGTTGWLSANFTPTGLPASADRVFFRSTNNNPCTSGMDQGGIDLALLDTDKNYTSDVGSSGDPLLIAGDKLDLKGSGSFYVRSDSDGTGKKIDEIIARLSNPSSIVQIGSATTNPGDVDRIEALRGNIITESNLVFGSSAKMLVGSVNSPDGDVVATINASNTLAELLQWGGRATTKTTITAARVNNANIVVDDNPIITLEMFNSNCQWNDASETGDGIELVLMGNSVLTLKNSLPMTITTVRLFENSEIIRDSNIHTITNLIDRRVKQ